MMDYKEFVETLMSEINAETGLRTEFHEADEKIPRDGIWVYISEDENGSHVLRLLTMESYRKWNLKEVTFHELVQTVRQSAEDFHNTGVSVKMKQLKNYNLIKNSLFIRLLNIERNKEELKDSFYRKIGDIALVLYVKIADEGNVLVSSKVPLRYIEDWKLNEQDVFMDALRNTESMTPPRAYNLFKMVQNPDYEGDNIYDPDYIPGKNEAGNCLSTNLKTNGAVAIFFPSVASMFCRKMETDEIYLSFTSIHEVMIHNAECMEPEDLKSILEDTIKEATPVEDRLTGHIYHYSLKTDRIEMLL